MLSLIFISLPDSMTSIIGRKMMMIITVMSIFRDIMSCYRLFGDGEMTANSLVTARVAKLVGLSMKSADPQKLLKSA